MPPKERMLPKERAERLAAEFMAGFAENFRCPDVAPSEYRGVMAYRIEEVIKEAIRQSHDKSDSNGPDDEYAMTGS